MNLEDYGMVIAIHNKRYPLTDDFILDKDDSIYSIRFNGKRIVDLVLVEDNLKIYPVHVDSYITSIALDSGPCYWKDIKSAVKNSLKGASSYLESNIGSINKTKDNINKLIDNL